MVPKDKKAHVDLLYEKFWSLNVKIWAKYYGKQPDYFRRKSLNSVVIFSQGKLGKKVFIFSFNIYNTYIGGFGLI